MTVTIIGERRRRPPYGLSGGGPGTVGEDTLQRGDRIVKLPGKITFSAKAGDRVSIATPGGGGHGDPMRAKFWAAVLSGEAMSIE
jgi:N-methylhydantoinase B